MAFITRITKETLQWTSDEKQSSLLPRETASGSSPVATTISVMAPGDREIETGVSSGSRLCSYAY